MKNKITIISIILCIFVFIGIAGSYFYTKNIAYNVTIVEKFWDAYGAQYHNKELMTRIRLNDQIKVNGGSGDEITFKVVKVNKDSVTIQTSEEMSQVRMDSLSIGNEFIININEETVLNRFIMGSGVSYTIKLER